ncbi:hypothetical protein OH76DRAFT_1559618 [Lentinus brumalis]|uniref:Uncharacterized protein n=1 Tax=Lentinus brumalis TaxID=2498619 RepID=A0A371CW72_9APHY|nr:hypothetical protein OH76DRAFT_1559618 [Polyporus brumalis]
MQAIANRDRATSPDREDVTNTSRKPATRKSPPPQVNCFPLPPLAEWKRPRSTGAYYYGIYVAENAIEEYAVRVNPEAANHPSSIQYFYGLDHLRWIANDQSLDIQIAVIRPRHKEAMPCITENRTATILCLFPMEIEAVKKRMSAETVDKLANALGCKPDWYEIYFFS